jgi:glycosyltransferase involved in cell wall biosynthesis
MPELLMVVHARYPVGEPRVEREARAAQAAGYRVRVICLRHAGEAAAEELNGVSVRRLPVEHRRGVGLARAFLEYMRFIVRASILLAIRDRPRRGSIVQLHAPPEGIAVVGVVPRLRGCRIVLDVHDLSRHMFEARVAAERPRRAGSSVLALVERLACRLADRVITVHEPYREELEQNGVPGSKLSVIMNSADPEVIRRARSSAPESRAGEEFVVAYHGTLNEGYGVDLLIQAIALLRRAGLDTNAMILGEGDALSDLRALARNLEVDDLCRFNGTYLPHVDALAAVRQADCGVIPNKPSRLNRFALSSKLFEYVELGIPAIVSALPTLMRHFSQDEVRLFTPGDEVELADAIRWVREYRDLAAEMAERALVRAREYSWDRNRSRYLELLAAL